MKFLTASGTKLNRLLEDKPIWFLILANVYPIVGVFAFGWDYFMIVLLYIAETVVIGLYNALKMAKAEGTFTNTSQQDISSKTNNAGCLKFFLVPFFLFHYNFFVVGQTAFVVILSVQFGERDVQLSEFYEIGFILNIVMLFVSHGYSYFENYIKKKEYKQATPPMLMAQPYKRIFIQQFTVIFGSFLIVSTNAPVAFLGLLIVLKTIFDIRAHFKLHDIFNPQKSSP